MCVSLGQVPNQARLQLPPPHHTRQEFCACLAGLLRGPGKGCIGGSQHSARLTVNYYDFYLFSSLFSQWWGKSKAWRERQRQHHLGVTKNLRFYFLLFYHYLLCFCEEHKRMESCSFWNQPYCFWSLASVHHTFYPYDSNEPPDKAQSGYLAFPDDSSWLLFSTLVWI